jgi:hypothetical protein
VLLLAAVALLAACNGDDDTTSPTSAAAISTSPVAPTTDANTPSTTSPATTTAPTASPTTTAATTTIPPTTVPSTTAPPTSSVPLSDEEQVLALVENTYAVWRECLRDVPDCDGATFRAYFTGPLLANRLDLLEEWQANGYEVLAVDSYTYEVLEVNLDSVIPHVVLCESDGAAIVKRRPGEPDEVIDQRYVERIRELHLVHTPLGWRAEGFATREEVEGQEGALCS